MTEATKVLARAELADGYRAACAASAPNAYARRNHIYSPFFLERGSTNARFLEEEIPRIQLLNGTDIVVLHATADQGYPHTRGANVVCIPAAPQNFSSREALAETLRHEAMHIDQKRRPTFWEAACRRRGWTPLSSEEPVPQRFREQCRLNPDTMTPYKFWAWAEHHVPLALFSSETPSSLSDIVVKWLDLRNTVLYSSPPSTFFAQHGPAVSQPEHPFEIYAVEAAAKQEIIDIDSLDRYLRS